MNDTVGPPPREGYIGLSERHLHVAASRAALWLRCIVVVLSGAFGVFAADAVDLGAVIALVGCVTGWCVFRLRLRHSLPTTWFSAVDVLIVVTVGLSQLDIGPQPVSSWVFAVASITSVTCFYEWPHRPVAAWCVAGASVAGFMVGNLLAGPDDGLLGVGVRLAVQTLLAWVGFVLVRGAARIADRIAERAAVQRRDASVAVARRAAEREYLAMLHDTASTTLLMVSTGSIDDVGWLPERARRDLEALGTVPGSVAREIDLASLLGRLVHYPGLRIDWDVRGPLTLPAAAAFAIFFGVREALNNVRQHAGDTHTTLCAHQRDGGGVAVRVVDRGRGFRPAAVSPHRRGISASIVDRMSAVGGRAEVTSAVGAGTTVCWMWPA
ncbi:sensor histidine kinase [Actinokineospora sp.]|uniref:sensor histidine kinase n=1 Tax=Actinokineospora sp. TaxID=1872133 RepID=UPI004037AC03